MSHFTVVVCLSDPDGKLAKAAEVSTKGFPDGQDIPAFGGNNALLRRVIDDRLTSVLAPWDENAEVRPYRVYEEGGPESYWLYESLREADKDDRDGTGILPYEPDKLGWSSGSSKETPAEQALAIARKAAIFRSLPEPATWESVIDAANVLYPDDTETRELQVDEDGRAYKMSTYNPDSKWDYWRIGGRWGGQFPFRQEFASQVIMPERGWDSPEEIKLLSCDGGPKRALDLAAMRDAAEEQARKTYATYHALVDHLPEALPWSSFADNISEGTGYTIDQARQEYRNQPRVQAVSGTDFAWGEDVITKFSVPVDLYAEKARAGAVPGFALVTTDGRWMAPGNMGWFAITDANENTRISYWEAANAYVESLPDSAWLVVIDCHI